MMPADEGIDQGYQGSIRQTRGEREEIVVKLGRLPGLLIVSGLAAAAMCTEMFAGQSAATGERVESEVTQQIQQMEAKLTSASRAHDAAALDQLYWDDLIDIHASGWTYTKSENLELSRNLPLIPVTKVIRTNEIGRKIAVFNKDAAEVVWENETYFEVPDPEEVARQAGTLTENPEALAKAAAKGTGIGPGDGPAPNPYRVRNTRLWVRFNGQWKIASSTSTRISERVVPGRF